jgi:hypothetical protein
LVIEGQPVRICGIFVYADSAPLPLSGIKRKWRHTSTSYECLCAQLAELAKNMCSRPPHARISEVVPAIWG